MIFKIHFGIFIGLFFVFLIFPSSTFSASIIDVNKFDETFQTINEKITNGNAGAATNGFSFQVPPGRNGLQPSISLTYNSHSTNSIENYAGSGWSLSNSYIERDINYTPSNTTDDIFYLYFQGNKQELVFDGSAGFYKTLVDSFSRIEQKTGSVNNNQGTYWLVTTPDGTKFRLGHETSSEEVCSDRSYVRRWYLDLVTDTNGNEIYYTYNEVDDYSYLDKIEYNNEKSRVIDLVYDSTASARVGTLNGCLVRQTQRLNSIEIEVNNNLYKEYELSYEIIDTSTNLLSAITEKDATGNSLPSTTFQYHDEVRAWSVTPQTWYDDDHNPDISLDYRQTKLIDVNRDSFPDILWSQIDGNNRKLKVYKSNGSSFSETSETWYDSSTYPEVDLTRDDSTIIDVNGDSLPDIVWSKKLSGNEREWYVLLNDGDSWATTAIKWYDSTNDGLLHLEETSVMLVDVNGDGLPDIVRTEEFQDGGTFYRLLVYKNTGSSWSDQVETWVTTDKAINLERQPVNDQIPDQVEYFNSNTRIIDVTNDGLPDIVYSEPYNNGDNRRWNVFVNTGDGFNSTPLNWFEDSSDFDLTNRKFTMFDANGDGYVDIVKGEKGSGGFNLWNVWINNGNGWNKPPVEFLNDNADPDLGLDTNNVAAADVNGDGNVDLISTSKGSNNQRVWKVTLNNSYATNRLRYLVNSTGGTTSISYTPSTSFDNTNSDDLSDLPFPLWLISQSTQNNGMSGVHQRIFTINYSYLGGLYEFSDREVRGFSQVTSTDDISKTVKKFHQDKSRQGREYESSQKNLSDVVFHKSEQSWTDTLTNNIYSVLLTNSKEYKYDGQATPFQTQTDYLYDVYGNVTKITAKGDTSINQDDRVTEIEYAYNTNDWLVSYPKHIWKEDYNNNKLAENWFYYDSATDWNSSPNKGNLTKQVDWHNKGNNPTTTYAYDSYGNQLTLTDPRGKVTTTTFGTNDATSTYPDSVTNHLNHETEFIYDFASGNLLTSTDPNGYVTTYVYDTFGRLQKEIKPYDSSNDPTITLTYDLDGTAPEILITEQLLEASASASIKTYQIIDGYGQTVQTKSDAEDSSKQVVVDIFYDSRGNNAGQSNPYLATKSANYVSPDINQPKTVISYDLLNRPITLQNPDLTTRTTDYDRETITYTDENANELEHTLNGFGEIKIIKEFKNNDIYDTHYGYDALGNLVRITDDQHNDILFTYDSLSRQIGLTDPDMGTWLYYYDLNGNVGTTIDNRGIVVFSQFDDLNRLTKTDYPTDPDVVYTYDTVIKGPLAQATSSNYTISYTYDQRYRQTSQTTVIDGFTWTESMAYNSANQVTWQTYPDGQAVEYTYNDQGLVESVGYSVSDFDYTASGKIASKSYPNGLTSSFTYDSDTTRLTQLQTGTLQNLTYGYDDVGNVTTFADSVIGTSKTYAYDDLNRITSSVDPLGNSYGYDYDSVGNMISLNVNANTYQFEYGTNAGPHALSAGNFNSPLGYTLPAFSQSQIEHGYGYYFSFGSTDTLGGISVATNDIARYDDTTSTWYMYFDGSDVGVTQPIDAFHLMDDGSILLSFSGIVNLGWGNIPHQDIVRFIPTQLGSTTEGTFELYFDGSNVGVSGSFGKLDAIAMSGNGDLLLSRATDSSQKKFIATGLRYLTAGTFEDFFEVPTGQTLTASWFNYNTNVMYYARSGSTNLFTCKLQLTGTWPECTNVTQISTSGWGVDKTISGFHYYIAPEENLVASEPDLIEGIYLSHDDSYTEVDGITFYDEDVAYYDIQTDTWSMYIDGSDLGLDDIDGFYLMDDGSILLSLGSSETFSFGTVRDEDVIKFTPTSLGDTTTGTIEMYFDGSDIGMTDMITGVSLDPNGNLLITIADTQGGSPVWGDVYTTYVFNATSLGLNTAGTLSRYFEGDDINYYAGYAGIESTSNGNLYIVPDFDVKLKKTTVAGEFEILRCQILDIGDNSVCETGIFFVPEFASYTAYIDALGLKLMEGSN